jgi:Domain of unknown function DUF488
MLANRPDIEVLTASYWEATGWPGVLPVRTSRTVPPQFPWPVVTLAQAIPPWSIAHLEGDEFRRAYRSRLHRSGAHLLTALDEFQAEYRRPMALLCWEPDPARCHRALLAEWLGQHGIEVTTR